MPRANLEAALTGPRFSFNWRAPLRTHAFNLSLLFIFLIPWEGVELPGLAAPAKFVGFAAAALWVATGLHSGAIRAPRAFQVVFLAYVFWHGVSLLWSDDPDLTAARTLTWVQLLVVVFMLWDLYTTRESVLAGLQAYVFGAYVAVGYALANYLSGAAYYNHYQRFSPSEDTNPDGFGFALALAMPAAWYLATTAGASKAGRLRQVLNFAYVPVGLLGITLSGTRSALIMAIPAMMFGLSSLMRLSRRARITALVLLAAVVLLLLREIQTMRSFQRFGTTIDELSEGDLNNRTNNWLEGLSSFTRRPLLGVGGNMYRSVSSMGKLAHNSYLSVLVELGLIGFALFAALLAIATVQILSLRGWERTFWLTQLAVWALGAFTLTWEFKKSTWLFLSLAVASAELARGRQEAEGSQWVPTAQRSPAATL